MNASSAILARAGTLAGKPAIVHYASSTATSSTTSYAQLLALVDRAANALVALGVARGDRVVLLIEDSPLACAAFLGVMKAGGVAMPVNPHQSIAELGHILRDSQAVLCIVDPALAPKVQASASQAIGHSPRLMVATGADDSFAAHLARSVAAFDALTMRPEEPAFWLYSSGTTGFPKGIIHTHTNATQSGKLLREVIGATDATVILSTSKLFFAYALDNAFLGALAIGATTVLNAAWPAPEQVIKQIARHRPHVLFTVPTLARRMLELGSDALAPLERVDVVYVGGERVPDALARRWQETIGGALHECYGASETYLNAIANPPGKNRVGSCGVPLPGVTTRLADREGNALAPAMVAQGEMGVLWVQHPSLALGYTDPSATRRSFRDGWFCTNDLFTIDTDGYFWHQGRADELLKVAGQWVKPGAIEEAVLGNDLIREASCVVSPDVDGFERLALFIVPGTGDADVACAYAKEQCAAKLPRHSLPKWIRAVAELPRTPTGKVQRFRLREWLLAEIKPGEPAD